MNSSKPPILATWLLTRFASDDALVGDLCEELAHGRSHWWYWREVLTAVVFGAFRDLAQHKLLALRAALTTVIGLLGFGRLVVFAFASFAGPQFNTLHHVLQFGICLSVAWLVGRLHRPYQAAMMFVPFAVMPSLGSPEFIRTLVNALTDERYTPYFVGYAEQMAGLLVATLVGSLLSVVCSPLPNSEHSTM